MAWEIFAIWTVAILTIAWFVHDERKLLANASMAQARLLYAPARPERHVRVMTLEDDDALAAEPEAAAEMIVPPRPVRREAGLTETQRRFLAEISAMAR